LIRVDGGGGALLCAFEAAGVGGPRASVIVRLSQDVKPLLSAGRLQVKIPYVHAIAEKKKMVAD